MSALTLPATLDALEDIGQFVKETAVSGGLDTGAAYRLRLAVDEMATNIVSYGGVAEIVIAATVTARDVTVTLVDNGVAFDPRRQALPSEAALAAPLEERDIGGLGIFLALTGVDRFDYAREGETNRNVFTMRKAPAAPPT